MALDEHLARIEEIGQRKELSGKARRELEELLSHVLADPHGQEALRERIQKGLAR